MVDIQEGDGVEEARDVTMAGTTIET